MSFGCGYLEKDVEKGGKGLGDAKNNQRNADKYEGNMERVRDPHY